MNGISSGVLISLGAYFLVMIGIGVYAYFQQANDSEGYMLGGRNLGPAVKPRAIQILTTPSLYI